MCAAGISSTPTRTSSRISEDGSRFSSEDECNRVLGYPRSYFSLFSHPLREGLIIREIVCKLASRVTVVVVSYYPSFENLERERKREVATLTNMAKSSNGKKPPSATRSTSTLLEEKEDIARRSHSLHNKKTKDAATNGSNTNRSANGGSILEEKQAIENRSRVKAPTTHTPSSSAPPAARRRMGRKKKQQQPTDRTSNPATREIGSLDTALDGVRPPSSEVGTSDAPTISAAPSSTRAAEIEEGPNVPSDYPRAPLTTAQLVPEAEEVPLAEVLGREGTAPTRSDYENNTTDAPTTSTSTGKQSCRGKAVAVIAMCLLTAVGVAVAVSVTANNNNNKSSRAATTVPPSPTNATTEEEWKEDLAVEIRSLADQCCMEPQAVVDALFEDRSTLETCDGCDGNNEGENIEEQLQRLEDLFSDSVRYSNGTTALVITDDIQIETYNQLGSSFGKIQRSANRDKGNRRLVVKGERRHHHVGITHE